MAAGNPLLAAAEAVSRQFPAEEIKATLQQPIIIVSAPRSGSNLLFEQMTGIAGFWSIGGESHGVFRAFPGLRAENSALDSASLGESHADPETRRLMRACFLCLLRDHRGASYLNMAPGVRPSNVTWLEKTPRNALNIPFLLEVFPRARFIYLHRDPRQNIASITEAWKLGMESGRFVTFQDLPGWDRRGWCFLLPPGWQSMIGKSLPEIAAFQWSASNDVILDCLATLPSSRWKSVSYTDLVANPRGTLTDLCHFAGITLHDQAMPSGPLPLSRTALTPPHPDKWKKYEQELNELWPGLVPTVERIEAIRSS
jgi:hypothetical protein